jgi:hypothetical protein
MHSRPLRFCVNDMTVFSTASLVRVVTLGISRDVTIKPALATSDCRD